MTATICVDASFIIRLVLGQGEAVQSLWQDWIGQGREFIAPSLFYDELTNVLYRYARQGYLSFPSARLALEAAMALPISIDTDKDLHRQAFDLAEQFHLPAAYDAHYLALAKSQDAEFWSLDQRLVQACSLEWVKLVPAT